MSKRTYKILNYIVIVLILASLAGLIVALKFTDGMGVYPNLCLCLFVLFLIGLLVLQCVYRVTKKPFEPERQIKNCPHCNTINDIDSEYCKKCGKKFESK